MLVLRYSANQTLVNSDIVCTDGDVIIVCLSINPPSDPDTVSVQSTTYNSATIQ